MEPFNVRLGIRKVIPFVLFVMIPLFGMGNTAGANTMDLLCMVSTSSGLSYDGIINNVHITKGGYVASTDEALLDRAIRLAISGSRRKFEEFIVDNPFVFYLKANLWAQIEKQSWPGKIKIKLMDFDLSVWTVKEAVE